jgi:hypothetical protein
MSKLRFLFLALLGLMGGYLLGGILHAEGFPLTGNSLTNGDFETGDLSGWTSFTTPYGTLGSGFPKVAPFDTNGDGTATYSAQFSVGQLSGNTGYQGGGISQNVYLSKGGNRITVDMIATSNDSVLGNGEGGSFEVLVDGVVVDSYDFGFVAGNTTKRHKLATTVGIDTDGNHEFSIRITRPANEAPHLTQLIDNVVVRSPGNGNGTSDPASVPGKGRK